MCQLSNISAVERKKPLPQGDASAEFEISAFPSIHPPLLLRRFVSFIGGAHSLMSKPCVSHALHLRSGTRSPTTQDRHASTSTLLFRLSLLPEPNSCTESQPQSSRPVEHYEVHPLLPSPSCWIGKHLCTQYIVGSPQMEHVTQCHAEQ